MFSHSLQNFARALCLCIAGLIACMTVCLAALLILIQMPDTSVHAPQIAMETPSNLPAQLASAKP